MTYASIQWSRELGDLFPESNLIIVCGTTDSEGKHRFEPYIQNRYYFRTNPWNQEVFPAITLDMALDKLLGRIPNTLYTLRISKPSGGQWCVSYVNKSKSKPTEFWGRPSNIFCDYDLINAVCCMISHLRREGYYKGV